MTRAYGNRNGGMEGRDRGRNDDFRAKLVSIHVDNINPVMDQMGLWSIFKPFGRVRDVFLSSKNSQRSGLYAFVRFETKEEKEGCRWIKASIRIIEIGAQLGLNFNWKEAEMTKILRNREMEDVDQCGQARGIQNTLFVEEEKRMAAGVDS
ncbi:hypothetical protein LWI28_001622 [Acer negundo]|uniref:RRM domain-containing protein n=1 Tax=Acer negundo TaxID=4023 RepID=A0AAD5IXE9_ACENE|nr:hypothetical protein LWI28_001622 [Acer negundo]